MTKLIEFYPANNNMNPNNHHEYNVESISPEMLKLFFERREINYSLERGATILITNKQFIVTTNGPYAIQNHRDTIVNIHRQINNNKNVINLIDYYGIEKRLEKEFIIGKLVNEPFGKGQIEGGVYAFFSIAELNPHSITPNQFKLFKLFYEQYNDIFKEASEINGIPVVCYSFINDKNEYDEEYSNDLDIILNYLSKIVSNDIKQEKEEEIIGTCIKKDQYKKLLKKK